MKRNLLKGIFLVLVLVLIGSTALAAEPVKLHLFFYKQEIVNQLKEMTETFSKSHPDIAIDLEIVPNDSMTVLKARMASGQAPDIIQLQSYANVFEFANVPNIGLQRSDVHIAHD